MKHFLVVVMVIFLALLLALAGCAQKTTPSPVSPAPVPSPTAPSAPSLPSPPVPAPAPAPSPTLAPTPKATPKVTYVDILLTNFAFQPSVITVAKGQTVKFTLTGRGFPHTFTVTELGTNILVADGQILTFEVTMEKAGTFTINCTVPGHKERGMEGILRVTE